MYIKTCQNDSGRYSRINFDFPFRKKDLKTPEVKGLLKQSACTAIEQLK